MVLWCWKTGSGYIMLYLHQLYSSFFWGLNFQPQIAPETAQKGPYGWSVAVSNPPGLEPNIAGWWKMTSRAAKRDDKRRKWRGLGSLKINYDKLPWKVKRETESSSIETLPRKELLATAELPDDGSICYDMFAHVFPSEFVDARNRNPTAASFFFPQPLDRSHCTAFVAGEKPCSW